MVDMCIPIACGFLLPPKKKRNFKRCFWCRLSPGGKVRWISPQGSVLRDEERWAAATTNKFME